MTTVGFGELSPSQDSERTKLHGWKLWLARGVWFLLCGATLIRYGALLPLILRMPDYGDWVIQRSAAVFGINIFSRAYDTYALLFLGLKYFALAVFLGVAIYIFWRKSDDWMAILVSVTLFVFPNFFNLGGYTDSWGFYGFPLANLFSVLDSLLQSIGFALLFLFFFLFPDGRFAPRWTRWFALVSSLAAAIIWLSDFFRIPVLMSDEYGWFIFMTLFFAVFLLATWSQVYRYRHVSTRAQQVQTRLVVLSLVAIAIGFVLLIPAAMGLINFLDTPLGALLISLLSIFSLVLLPLAFGVAMLRDQLWASERILNRAFVYGALSAILLLIYVVIVGALSEVLRAANNFVIAAAATGVVALLFHPLRERLQKRINRFLYGERDEPLQVLNRLGAQLENSATPASGLPLIVETTARAMRVPYAEITLTTDDGPQTGTVHYPPSAIPRLAADLMAFPLRYQDQVIGELQIARRAPNESFSSADLQLLENLARQAGAVAYTARLNAQLQQSRERIIKEREQERRRLRRDLHDGLGPTLASQTLKLDAAMELLDGQHADTTSARSILADVKAQTQNTVADIRRIVYELRPPALDDLGLIGALQAHLGQYREGNGLQIRLDAPSELPPLSAAVQVNAYRIVLEAVNNVLRHAGARMCVVEVRLETGAESNVKRETSGENEIAGKRNMMIMVADDGVGMPEKLTVGVGITSMRERAEELGGMFKMEPNNPTGTRVIATLPISNLYKPSYGESSISTSRSMANL